MLPRGRAHNNNYNLYILYIIMIYSIIMIIIIITIQGVLPGGRARRELLAGADAPGQEVGVGVHLRHLSRCLHLLSR